MTTLRVEMSALVDEGLGIFSCTTVINALSDGMPRRSLHAPMVMLHPFISSDYPCRARGCGFILGSTYKHRADSSPDDGVGKRYGEDEANGGYREFFDQWGLAMVVGCSFGEGLLQMHFV